MIRNQPPSAEVREKLAAEGKPVLLAFSCGKDSIAAWLALQDSGIEVVPAYLYLVPGLPFIEDQIKYFEDTFGQKIHQYPHPSLYRWISAGVFQAPERVQVIEAAGLPVPTYEQLWDLVRADLEMPTKTWLADGVRAADSIVRRASFVKHGVMKPKGKKVSVVADWVKAEVMGRIEEAGIDLPIDYEWFGRSFDGLDARFTAVLKEKSPKDFAVIKKWFPLVDVDGFRAEMGQ